MWQPINTWPRPKVEDFAIVYAKLVDDPESESPIVQEAMWDGDKWVCLYLSDPKAEVIPTHWMPLPKKPTDDPKAAASNAREKMMSALNGDMSVVIGYFEEKDILSEAESKWVGDFEMNVGFRLDDIIGELDNLIEVFPDGEENT